MNDTMMIRNPETNEWEAVYLPPTGDTYPIGAYAFIAGEKAPTGWLRADGQAVSRTEYAGLYREIGTTYGSGDGSTTFNLPNVNLANRTLVGSSGDGEFALGNTTGEKEHTLTIDEMPSHEHTTDGKFTFYGDGSSSATLLAWGTGSAAVQSSGSGQAHNNMQPSMAAICIIKAKQSVGLVGTVTDDINDQNDNAVPNAKTVTEALKTNYILVTSTTASSLSDNFKILLNSKADGYGAKLTLENNSVKIGSGISKIKVSASVFVNGPNQTGYVWGKILKNEETISSSIIPYANQGGFLSTPIPASIVDVSENDEISLIADSTCNGTLRTGKANTWLLVEVIE